MREITFLVTGGAGFIGSNICEYLLNDGYKVICLDNFISGRKENIDKFLNNPKFKLINGDITNFELCDEACTNVDYILHQAALGSVPRSMKYPLMYSEMNIKGSLNIFEAARKNNVKRVVYASSSSVYGDSLTLPKKEGAEGNILSPYALTKRVVEEYGDLYTRLYGIETIGLRYFNVYGRNQNPLGDYAAVIPKFINLLTQGKSVCINSDGLQTRDFTYVDDVVSANVKACFAPKSATGKVYNIAAGERNKLIDVYNKISKELNVDIEPEFTSTRPGDIRDSHADISKAKENLGYVPEFTFDKGLKLTIDWYKNNSF